MADGESTASLLRELRQRQGRTLRSAASELGVDPSLLSRMERGERAIGDQLTGRLASYYSVQAEVIDLARGQVPADVLRILLDHPDELERLRARYGVTKDE